MIATRAPEAEKLYTVAEFEKMPEFHERYELIEGRVVEKPMPSGEHSLLFE